jgi:uridine kinase
MRQWSSAALHNGGVPAHDAAEEVRGRDAVLRLIAEEILGVGAATVTRVAVDGVDGAGKTTFADELAATLEPSGRQVMRVSADDFLNPRSVRYRLGRASPEGFFLDSYDYEALHRLVLEPLASGGSRRFKRRAFDLQADEPIEAAEETAASDAILVLDGLFLHRDELYGLWDYSVFLDVDFAVSVARCAARGTGWASPDVDAPSNRRYVGGQQLYLSRCAPQRRATRVIDNNVLTAPAIVGSQ